MKISITIILLFISLFCEGQANGEREYINPYMNGQLSQYYNPNLVDFSKEFLIQSREGISTSTINITDKVKAYKFDVDSIFKTWDKQQNGIIGTNYKRIRIHISKAEQSKDVESIFIIKGKSNVDGNICDFKGTLKIIDIYEFTNNIELAGQAVLYAEYELVEDSLQTHTGIFRGTFECFIVVDHKLKTVRLDMSSDVADGYNNRTYVGTWTNFKGSAQKKCIWGDYRLPYTFDFDCGDGEMMINEKYKKNGWESFGDGSEFEFIGDSFYLKDKWWISK